MAELQIGPPEEVASGQWIRVVRRRCVGQDGKTIEWESVERTRVKEIVAVFAVTLDGKVPLVDQIRPSFGNLNQRVLDLPAGLVDPGETPAVAAKRELFEETGYCADISVEFPLGPECAGLSDCHVHTYFAPNAVQRRGGFELALESSERLLGLRVVEFALNDLPFALMEYQAKTGALIDSRIASALAFSRVLERR